MGHVVHGVASRVCNQDFAWRHRAATAGVRGGYAMCFGSPGRKSSRGWHRFRNSQLVLEALTSTVSAPSVRLPYNQEWASSGVRTPAL